MYLMRPKIMISSSKQMNIKHVYDAIGILDRYDEVSSRWFCELGCGFRYHKDADDVLYESAEIASAFFAERENDTDVRESCAMVWTYDYEEGAFDCEYELSEYEENRVRSIQFAIGGRNQKNVEELDEAIRQWHITGQMVWEGVIIDLGDWEPAGSP